MDQRKQTPLDVRIGMKVRQRRVEIGMSQNKLAKTIGISFQQVQKYEQATNRISVSRLALIADALRRPVSWFFDVAKEHELPDDMMFDKDAFELMKNYNHLPEKYKPVARQLVRTLAQSIV